MNKTAVLELIRNGEDSLVEFKRDEVSNHDLHYGLKPALGASLDTLDLRRLQDYFERVRGGSAPQHEDREGWEKLLRNVDLMTDSSGTSVATVDGVLLFASAPNRHVPQAGIRAICYPGTEPDYATRADEDLWGSMVPLAGADGPLIGLGLVDAAWDFVRRNTTPTARIESMRRVDRWEYPEDVVREVVPTRWSTATTASPGPTSC